MLNERCFVKIIQLIVNVGQLKPFLSGGDPSIRFYSDVRALSAD